MPLINTSLPNLIQGVSQQPDTLRYEGQCDEQINAVSSIVGGLRKRPPSEFIKDLGITSIPDNALIEFIDRDDDEKFLLLHTGDTLRIFTLKNANLGNAWAAGDESEIKFDADSSYQTSGLTIPSTHYLFSTDPKSNLRAFTIGDTTFLCNNTKTVSKYTGNATYQSDGYLSGLTDTSANIAYVFIKQGDYKKEYTVTINGTAFSATSLGSHDASDNATPENASTKAIRDLVRTAVAASFTCVDVGDYGFAVEVPDNAVVSVSDALSGNGIGIVYKEVSYVSDLPQECVNGLKVLVKGDPEVGGDDYYSVFRVPGTELGDIRNSFYEVGKGVWEETNGFSIDTTLNETTMPYILESLPNNQFNVTTMKLDTVMVGDEDTNPFPSFVGSQITNMFLFRNRVGILSTNKVILTEDGLGSSDDTGQFYNFFRTTVTSLLDSDNIDVTVASDQITNLKSASPLQGNLILFSDTGQFSLKGGDLLTPKTVTIEPITNYDYSDEVDPLSLGAYIYFPFTRGSYTGFREFAIDSSTEMFDGDEITSHVPSYIDSNVQTISGSSSENLIAVLAGTLAGDSTTDVCIYKYFFQNRKKLLSSWFKFKFSGAIRSLAFLDSELYLLTEVGSSHNLSKVDMRSNMVTDDIDILLDNKTKHTNVTGTSITLPYTPSSSDVVEAIDETGTKLPCSRSGATVTLDSSVTTATIHTGVKYEMRYKFSEVLFKASAGKGESPSNIAEMKLKNGAVFYHDTGYFKTTVTPVVGNVTTSTFTSPNNTNSAGSHRFMIFTDAEDCGITLTNDSHKPSNFSSAEFESFTNTRSKRYG